MQIKVKTLHPTNPTVAIRNLSKQNLCHQKKNILEQSGPKHPRYPRHPRFGVFQRNKKVFFCQSPLRPLAPTCCPHTKTQQWRDAINCSVHDGGDEIFILRFDEFTLRHYILRIVYIEKCSHWGWFTLRFSHWDWFTQRFVHIEIGSHWGMFTLRLVYTEVCSHWG